MTKHKDPTKFGTDAAKWSKAFAERLGQLGNEALDASPGGDLFGWVANMIEAGRSAGYAEGDRASRREEITSLSILPGMHGLDVNSLLASITEKGLAPDDPVKLANALDEAFNRGALFATRVNVWNRDGFDVTAVDHVEFKTDGSRVWLNVDGKLSFRAAYASVVTVEHVAHNALPHGAYDPVSIPADPLAGTFQNPAGGDDGFDFPPDDRRNGGTTDEHGDPITNR